MPENSTQSKASHEPQLVLSHTSRLIPNGQLAACYFYCAISASYTDVYDTVLRPMIPLSAVRNWNPRNVHDDLQRAMLLIVGVIEQRQSEIATASIKSTRNSLIQGLRDLVEDLSEVIFEWENAAENNTLATPTAWI